MYNNTEKIRSEAILNSQFSIFNSRSGITLIEVLVSVFVIGIGLLGAMAVIPFGAYQVSKAEQAKYTANMLANAANDIIIKGMAKPEHWVKNTDDTGTPVEENEVHSGGIVIYKNTLDTKQLNCSRVLMIDPFVLNDNDKFKHIYRIGGEFNRFGLDNWKEWLRGQDDLQYEIDEATNRPAVKKDKDGNIESTGRYTWFFTYQPKATESDYPDGLTEKYEAAVDVDILGCCNRIPGDDQQVEVTGFTATLNGGVLTLSTDKTEELSQTKYILVTWDGTPQGSAPPGSAWCKVLFAKGKDVMVTGALANFDSATNRQVYIANGVLYHKQAQGVKIKD